MHKEPKNDKIEEWNDMKSAIANGKESELVFIAKKWYNKRYEKRISSNKLRKWFDRQTMGSNQRILSIQK